MFKKTLSTCILLGVCCAPLAVIAQQDEHHDDNARQQQSERHDGYDQQRQADRRDDRGQQHEYVEHREWRRGYHMNHDDWDRGQQVDYRAHHLQRPRSGYEWREIDGHYVMANRDGVVTTVIVARH